jgi:hypothetical protein
LDAHADVEAACEHEFQRWWHERQTQCTLDPEIHKAVEKLRSEGDLTPARADFLDDVESGLAEIQDIFWEAASVRDDVEREVVDGSHELEAAKLTGCTQIRSGGYRARITAGAQGRHHQIALGLFRSKTACHSAYERLRSGAQDRYSYH